MEKVMPSSWWTKKWRVNRSKFMKQCWKQPKFKKKMSDLLVKRWKNPEYRKLRTLRHPPRQRYIDSQGYVRVHMPSHHRAHYDGYVLEHIVVLEQKIGRPIAPNSSCHHLNGIRDDNRPENLVEITRSEHGRHHMQGTIEKYGGSFNKGSRNGMSKLTESQVVTIRTLYRQGMTQASLMRKFNASRANICLIVHRKSWKHLKVHLT